MPCCFSVPVFRRENEGLHDIANHRGSQGSGKSDARKKTSRAHFHNVLGLFVNMMCSDNATWPLEPVLLVQELPLVREPVPAPVRELVLLLLSLQARPVSFQAPMGSRLMQTSAPKRKPLKK
jgi:hypothetical protein